MRLVGGVNPLPGPLDVGTPTMPYTYGVGKGNRARYLFTTQPAMNRTVIVVKDPGQKKFCLIRLHWQSGQIIEDWLTESCPDWDCAWFLISRGHRESISTRIVDQCPAHEFFRTLREARAYCEHRTLAYYNGKCWRFEHRE